MPPAPQVEDKLGRQLEEEIRMCENELSLIPKMAEWKPWEVPEGYTVRAQPSAAQQGATGGWGLAAGRGCRAEGCPSNKGLYPSSCQAAPAAAQHELWACWLCWAAGAGRAPRCAALRLLSRCACFPHVPGGGH